MAVLGLRFCARAFSSCGKRGPLHDIVNILNINELFTLRWLISYYVNLTSINYYLKNSQ